MVLFWECETNTELNVLIVFVLVFVWNFPRMHIFLKDAVNISEKLEDNFDKEYFEVNRLMKIKKMQVTYTSRSFQYFVVGRLFN